jgi:hypothetical protein
MTFNTANKIRSNYTEREISIMAILLDQGVSGWQWHTNLPLNYNGKKVYRTGPRVTTNNAYNNFFRKLK